MDLLETGFKDLLLLKPRIFYDSRGYFYESYNKQVLNAAGISCSFVQDNQSESTFGVVRGLHFQVSPHAQTKLVRVLLGEIYDVAVDLRRESSSFGKWYGIKLSDENKLQLLIPKGFAHGFSVLSGRAVVLYKTDDFYHKEAERGIIFNDSTLNIDWHVKPSEIIVSDRDLDLPRFEHQEANLFM
jgi:dTDP-4-dehydrorhamnose 3,5-epimerase